MKKIISFWIVFLLTIVSAEAAKGPRKFYLTQEGVAGSEALSACAEGYHMAALWEIFDFSNEIRHDTWLDRGRFGIWPSRRQTRLDSYWHCKRSFHNSGYSKLFRMDQRWFFRLRKYGLSRPTLEFSSIYADGPMGAHSQHLLLPKLSLVCARLKAVDPLPKRLEWRI